MDAPTSRKQQQGLALSAQRYMVTNILFEQELVSKIREKILCLLLKRKTKYIYLSPEMIQLTELTGVRAYV